MPRLIYTFVLHIEIHKWAATWQNQQNDLCAQGKLRSTQSDHSSLSAWRNIGPLTTYWAYSEDSVRSDWADAQADLSLCWVHVILLVLLCGGSQMESICNGGLTFKFKDLWWEFWRKREHTTRQMKLPNLVKKGKGVFPESKNLNFQKNSCSKSRF